MLDSSRPTFFASLVDLLRYRAAEQPNDRAYAFVSDQGREEAELTFAALEQRASAVAARLAHSGEPGERALLLFGPGLDFIVAYFGCLIAGVIPVPMMLPRRNSSLDASASILTNCSPRYVMGNAHLRGARPDVIERFSGGGMQWVIVDELDAPTAAATRALPTLGRDDIAFLQYTSGSTSDPKGVMVSHGNLLENLEMIRVAVGNTRRSSHASWVPLYHDMGLILNVLETIYLGAPCILMAPVTFMQRPMSWLRAIHNYRIEVAGGPNFAFDHCVERFRPEQVKDLDLSCWKMAFNAAEPVRADSIDRFVATFAPYGFDARAVHPLYGMAEATVLVSSGRRGDGPIYRTVSRKAFQQNEIAAAADPTDGHRVVGCGKNIPGQELAIVDPETRRRLPADQIGEVWVSGPHICKGYWRNPEATAAVFGAVIEGEGDARWLRTGDLGFLDAAGELFIAGRLKDVVIVRGNNHYPQDIENTVYGCHPSLRRHCGAVFSVPTDDREKVVLVQEVERTRSHQADSEEIKETIREAVANEHEISFDSIVLIRPGTIPKTTSGKIQRSLTRRLWLDNAFEQV